MTSTDYRTTDLVRSVALGVAAAAQTLIPALAPLLTGRGEDTARYDTVVTPPDYAFAIWAPIFAGSLANAGQHALPRRAVSADNRQTGWPLAGAYALNAVWSLAARTDRFWVTPAILATVVGLTGVAHDRLQSRPTDRETITSTSTGLLLGWTALAATVNASAATQLRGADPTSRTSVTLSTLGGLGVAAAVATVAARSHRGYLPLAAATGWGLGTTAANRARPVGVRIAAGLGSVAVLAAAAANRRRTATR